MSRKNKLMEKCVVGYIYIQLLLVTLFYPFMYLGLCVLLSPLLLFGKRVARIAKYYFKKGSSYKYQFYDFSYSTQACYLVGFVIIAAFLPLFSAILIPTLLICNAPDASDLAIICYFGVMLLASIWFTLKIDEIIRQEDLDYIYNKSLKEKVRIVILGFVALIAVGVIDYYCLVYLLNM